jgi:hypothetical protein
LENDYGEWTAVERNRFGNNEQLRDEKHQLRERKISSENC